MKGGGMPILKMSYQKTPLLLPRYVNSLPICVRVTFRLFVWKQVHNEPTMQQIDKRATIQATELIPLRGPSGRLYGYLDPRNMIIEFKSSGRRTTGNAGEVVDLKPYLEAGKQ